MIEQNIGNYRVVSELGEGGMGKVYVAEHSLIGRRAAIKMLLPQFCANEQIVGRFFNEARAATAIRHPGIVEVFDFGHHTDGSAFIVMELLEGESLSARLGRGRMPLPQALLITRQIAGALGAAHAKGIVHRDLKPDNVFLVPDADVPGGERVKVLDFGIAKLGEDQSDGVKTGTGMVMGTPAYMAPEQCRGAGNVDARADLYALGCILYEILTGRTPFVAEGTGALLAAQIYEPLSPARTIEPSIPEPIDALLSTLLAKDPNHRLQTTDALIAAIDAGGLLGQATLPATAAPSDQTRMLPGQPGPASAPQLHTPAPYPGQPTPAPHHAHASAPPQVPTTLSAAASESGETTRSSGGMGIWGALAVAVIGLGIGGYQLWSSQAGDPGPASQGAVQPPAPPDARVIPPDAAVAEPTPPPPRRVEVVLDSEPEGATVFRKADGARIGTTPYRTELEAADGTLVYLLELDGYERAEVEIPAQDGGARAVELTREPRERTRPRRRRPPRPERPSPREDEPAAPPAAPPDARPAKREVPLDNEPYNPFAY